jgi:hypothetical protein
MTTNSRPVIYDEAAITAGDITADDTNVTGTDWARLWVRDGGVDSGISLTLSSTSDVGTISTGVGVWRGFILNVTAAHDVNLPAVTSAKTYSVGVLLDPADFSTAAGPLSIAVFDKTAITIPSGGGFWTLWEIDRIPATALSVSTVRTYRHGRGTPVIYCATLPLPEQYSFGQVAVTDSTMYVRNIQGGVAAWHEVLDDTGDVTTGVIAGSGWANNGTAYRKKKGVVYVDAAATLTGPAFSGNATGSISDQLVVTMPAGARPTRMKTANGSLTLAGADSGTTMDCGVRMYPDGRVVITNVPSSLTVATGSSFFVSIPAFPV